LLERFKKEEGFTLIEILAALLILSIVSLVMTAYFSNAMTFAKSNQNKTIMSNLARSALVYMQKQDFAQLESYFLDRTAEGEPPSITPNMFDICSSASSGVCEYREIFGDVADFDPDLFKNIFSPTVNGVPYTIEVTYQPNIKSSLQSDKNLGSEGARLLIPIAVTVSGNGGPGADSVTVEGYVNAAAIR